MAKFIINYTSDYGNGSIPIEANSPSEALNIFNYEHQDLVYESITLPKL